MIKQWVQSIKDAGINELVWIVQSMNVIDCHCSNEILWKSYFFVTWMIICKSCYNEMYLILLIISYNFTKNQVLHKWNYSHNEYF